MQKDISPKDILGFIYNSLHGSYGTLYVMAGVSFLWSLDISLQPYLIKIIIDRLPLYHSSEIYTHLTAPCVWYCLAYLIYATGYRVYDYYVEIQMIPLLRKTIIIQAMDKLLQQSYAYHTTHLSGSLSNKIQDIASAVPEIIRIILDQFLGRLLALFIAIITLWQVHWSYGLSMLIWSCVFLILFFILYPKLSNLSDISSQKKSHMTGNILYSLHNIITIKINFFILLVSLKLFEITLIFCLNFIYLQSISNPFMGTNRE